MSNYKVVYKTKKITLPKSPLQCRLASPSYQNKFVYASQQLSICQPEKFTSTCEKFTFSVSAKQNNGQLFVIFWHKRSQHDENMHITSASVREKVERATDEIFTKCFEILKVTVKWTSIIVKIQ